LQQNLTGMKKIYLAAAATITVSATYAQSKNTTDTSWQSKNLSQVIVTGQYKPQSVKNSVYQVRVINNDRIRISGANNVQQVLGTLTGFRFSADKALGTSDITMMGMSGRNVKILLDGIPMLDRGDTRESLNQIDVNSIERIEIVEGPMSVSYGSDALAGVINIITKKNAGDKLSVTAKVQEETAGSEYHPFNYKGLHQQNLSLSATKNNWNFMAGTTHYDFDGFGGDSYGRGKDWKPKEQWLANAKIGYTKGGFNVYYRIDGLDETITARNAINLSNYKTVDQHYFTNRYMHQAQANYALTSKLQWTAAAAYTDYKRHTKTTLHDFQKNTDELTTGAGEQDISKFKSFNFRNTLFWQLSSKTNMQYGFDVNSEKASGDRIEGNPSITDVALFASAEIKPSEKINLRPGIRFIKNSDYNAPPAIPSFNAKISISKQADLRFAYAYGFRSPALRELYFYFVDVNHNIIGNPNLKAENSNNFSAALHITPALKNNVLYNATLTGFYNEFNNQIDFALASAATGQYTYLNVNKAKTTGFNLENKLAWKQFEASLGASLIGYYRKQYDDKDYIRLDNKDFLWSPEFTTTLSYNAPVIKTKFNLLYKYTGLKPQYVYGKDANNQQVLYIAETNAFNWADFTAVTGINKFITATAGIKNIFDVVNVNNTATATGSIHSSAGPVMTGYGRSYFIGLNFQWNKK
jgi:outer membrane receptor for ferrienterochelin and colicins